MPRRPDDTRTERLRKTLARDGLDLDALVAKVLDGGGAEVYAELVAKEEAKVRPARPYRKT